MENAGTIVGQRALQWDLSMIEPGLLLRIGPTSDANSVLEFVMDPNRDRGDQYLVGERSTGMLKTFIFKSSMAKPPKNHNLFIFIFDIFHYMSRKSQSDFRNKHM